MQSKNKKIVIPALALLLLLHFLYAFWWGVQKANLIEDEYLSFVLSNGSSFNLQFEEGKVYTGNDIFVRAFTPSHGFDYFNVWMKQSGDTHPPLFYYVLHTVSVLSGGGIQ